MNKSIAILTGLVFTLSINVWTFYPGVTSARLAIICIIIVSFIKLFNNMYKIPRKVIVLPLLGILAATFTMFGLLINDGTIWYIFSWVFLGLLGGLIHYVLHDFNQYEKELLLKTILYTFLIIIIYVVYIMYNNNVLFSEGHITRRWLDNYVPSGLNRFLNGITLSSLIILGALIMNITKSKAFNIFSFVALFVFLLIAITSGSRQSILVFSIYTLFLFFYIYIKNITNSQKPSFLILSSLLIVGYSVYSLTEDWFMQRFINPVIHRTTTSSDETRLDILEAGYDIIINNPFGIGAGNAYSMLGKYPHNGYLGFIMENGVVGFIFLLIIFIYTIRKYLTIKEGNSLSMLFMQIYIVLAIIMTLMNDLFREPIYWTTLGFLYGIIDSGKNR
ncbi:O-antigen ligase family protein [Natronogracilivirga saccharolytica]|uniref:O-antigen ligase family protein n=1 Tax=Natronogracilivirga saccharolytica TaxID=2812953 RepID=A0A8J7UUW6_9BACT|nr:O-antigen ligase family protein [Natronogracilivirga saccharolytica]MBP3191896.1 O-antigen ligase family protein [Natronogracilivirga saccharolytica]